MPDAAAPSWLDAAFVQEALRRGGDADAVVTSVSLNPVGASGDHYSSAMYRITAETTEGTRSLITKTLPPGDVYQAALREGNAIELEAKALADVIPKMQRFLEKSAPGRFQPIAARCPHHGDKPDHLLVLEDLAPQGYRMADRHRGLGLRHSLLALRTLARFHGSSVAILAEDPSFPYKPHGMVNSFRKPAYEQFEAFVTSGFQMVADVSRTYQDFPSKYADAIEQIKNKAYEKYKLIHDYRPGRFNVFVHGDFWVNNMMFRYEDDRVCDVRFVDFQDPHFTTPAVDLLYFLYTSLSEEVYQHHIGLLIREYHVSLVETMQLLGLQAPTLKEIVDEMEEFGFWGTLAALCILPVVKAEKTPDLEKSMDGNGEENRFIYATPTIERWFRRLLPAFYRKGLLCLKAVEG